MSPLQHNLPFLQGHDVDRTRLQAELLDWMRAWERGDPVAEDRAGSRFEALALAVFRHQFNEIPAYWAFCLQRGATPEAVLVADDIPLVPVTAFKRAPLCNPGALAAPACVFETSGTSDGQPGRVHLADTVLYDASLHATFQRFVVPDASRLSSRFRCISLVPAAETRPHSSLGYMVRQLTRRWDDGGGSEHLGSGTVRPDGTSLETLDIPGLERALGRAHAERRPVLLFATSIAIALWLDRAANAVWPLPPGSRVMDTGGPKGRRIRVSRVEQLRRLSNTLQIEEEFIVGELGMTELCSQRYETTARSRLIGDVQGMRAYAAPPWLRTRVLRPADRSPAALGEPGMLAHLDLANLDTCAFVLTADLGQVTPLPGHGTAIVIGGRIPGSEWRGCGLDAEDLALG